VSEAIGYDKRGSQRGWGGFLKLSAELRARKFAKVFALHRSIRTSLLHCSARIPERLGFAEAKGSILYTKTASRRGYEHDVLRNLAILQTVGVDPRSVPGAMQIGVPAEIASAVRAKLPERYVVIAPGSVWATKRWTVEGFSEVSRRLKARGDEPVLVGGGGTDTDVASVIESRSGALNFTGKLSLLESAAAIGGARAVISNDSAPLHMASAFKRPTVALFCSTIPEFGFGPWQTRSEILGVDGLSCRPCGRHGHDFCPTGTHACQIGITPERVIAALDRVLS